MALLYVIDGWDPTPWREAMHAQAPDREVRIWPDIKNPEEVEYALVWKPPHGMLRQLPKLKAVLCLGAGVDHIMADPDLPDVPIGRIVDANLTMRMTEYVVLQVLIHHRQQLHLAEAQRNKVWVKINQPAACDVRVGIMGLGVLGQDSAEKLRMLGFDVAGWSRTPKQIDGIACFSGEAELKPFLNRTDILVCLLPHTPETTGLLNMETFAALAQDGALAGPALINAGRGKVQVEADILTALEQGHLYSASLDVFETEPLDAASPLWSHPRVIVTPHIASDSDPASLTINVLAQIEEFERSGVLQSAVDPKRGY